MVNKTSSYFTEIYFSEAKIILVHDLFTLQVINKYAHKQEADGDKTTSEEDEEDAEEEAEQVAEEKEVAEKQHKEDPNLALDLDSDGMSNCMQD